MAKKKKQKDKTVVRYRKPLNINIGMIIFTVIFFYLILNIFTYFRKPKIQFYEVAEGSIVNNHTYTGVIFRDENVKTTESTGYVNFFIREGKRAARGSTIYSLDETGELGKFLAQNSGSNTEMSSDSVANLKQQLSSFSLSYGDSNFSNVYSEQYQLQSAVAEYMNLNALGTLAQAMQEQGINYKQITTDQAGVISYVIDSLEDVSPESVTAETFDKSKYTRTSSRSGDLIEQNSPIYKLIGSETWSLVFPISEEDQKTFSEKKYLTIKPSSQSLKLSGAYSTFTGGDGKTYARLDFSKYMVRFVSDRFLNFEVVTNEATGLKIPVSAVASHDFYIIPKEYLTTGGDADSGQKGFMKQTYNQNGDQSVVFTPVDVADTDDEQGIVYVEKKDGGPVGDGDYLIKPDSSGTDDRYQVGKTETMSGVYNINKGYAVFRVIDKLTENGEYIIARPNSAYGLSVYDRIVLDASSVEDGQLVYR